MNFKKWVKSIQTAGFNGALTLLYELAVMKRFYLRSGHTVFCVRRCQTTQPPKSSLQKLRARRSYGPHKHWLSTQTIPNKHTKKS